MSVLGRRTVYLIAVAVFLIALGKTMAFLNESYDVVRAAKGPEAAIAMALVGIGVVVLAQWIMILPLASRLRDAGRSLLWVLPAFIPFIGMIVFIPPIFFLSEE